MGTLILCGVESEGRSVVRKRKVVVNGLGDVDIVYRILLLFQELGNTVGCRSSVVSADGDKKLDVVVLEEVKIEILLEILVGRLEAAHLEIRTATVEVGVSLEEIQVFGAGIFAEESAVASVKADYPITIAQESLGDRAHHGVHSGSRTTATQYNYRIFHFD